MEQLNHLFMTRQNQLHQCTNEQGIRRVLFPELTSVQRSHFMTWIQRHEIFHPLKELKLKEKVEGLFPEGVRKIPLGKILKSIDELGDKK